MLELIQWTKEDLRPKNGVWTLVEWLLYIGTIG